MLLLWNEVLAVVLYEEFEKIQRLQVGVAPLEGVLLALLKEIESRLHE